MFWFISILIIILASFVLEYFLARKENRWPGLIIPFVYFVAASVFLILNLMNAFFTIEGYGLFLIEHGSSGHFAMIFKIGFIFTPGLIQLIIYFVCRHYYKKRNDPVKNNKELKKMIVDDLD